jgi:predicted RNase H-like HicB family nuclease
LNTLAVLSDPIDGAFPEKEELGGPYETASQSTEEALQAMQEAILSWLQGMLQEAVPLAQDESSQ